MADPFKNAASLMDAPIGRRKAFGGASTSRLYYDWRVANVSPDYELRGVLRLLRARARQLVNDNPYAAGFVEELANNVVGPVGIRLRPQITTQNDVAHKAANNAIKEAWADWGLPENASVDGHDSWTDLQRLVLQTIATDGECFLRRRMYYDNPHGFTLQIIDADQVDDLYNVVGGPGQNDIRMGVEINADGRPVAYHVRTRHPSDGILTERIRIPAEEIKHLFIRYRPNQHRGVTWFAPVLTSLKMHDGYSEAELVAARTAAAKMGFIVTDPASVGSGSVDPNDEDTERLTEASPGVIDELEPGQKFESWDPQHPNAAYDAFTKVILRGIARGLGISYTALTGDLLGVSYSSIRAGILPERDRWRALQFWFICQCHRWVYRNWVACALLTGSLQVDSRLAADFKDVLWKPRGWEWVDPLKDLQAAILAIQHGMSSRTQELDEEGGDLEETFGNLQREQELADEYGIDISPPAVPKANNPMGTPSEADQEEDSAGSGNGNNRNQNALSEDEELVRWAALQIAANDIALARRRRSLRKVE